MTTGIPKCRICKKSLERGPSLCGRFSDGTELASVDLGAWYFPARCPHACPREGQKTDLDADSVER